MTRRQIAWVVGAVSSLGFATANAAEVTWINPAGGQWTDASNWSSFPNLPAEGDDVVIPGSAGAYSVTLSSGTQTIASLDTNQALNVSTATLAVSGTVRLSSAGFSLDNGELRGATYVDAPQYSNLHGTLSAVTLDVPMTQYPNSSITIENGITANQPLTLSFNDFSQAFFVGTQTISGAGGLFLGGDASFTELTIDGGGDTAILTIAPGSQIANIGEIDAANPGKESLVIAGQVNGIFGEFDASAITIKVPFTLAATGQIVSDDFSAVKLETPFNWTTGMLSGRSYAKYLDLSTLGYHGDNRSAVEADGGLSASGSLMKAGSGTLYVGPAGFTLAAGSKLDLDSGELVVDVASGAASPIARIRQLLASGFNSGSWDGTGLASLAAHNDSTKAHGLGYALASQIGLTKLNIPGAVETVNGEAVDVQYTFYGDTDLSEYVDGTDFNNFVAGLDGQLNGWFGGDFNYDGVTDIGGDFPLFVAGFLQSRHPPTVNDADSLIALINGDNNLTDGHKSQMLALVPEPGTAIAALATIGSLFLRRRRSRAEIATVARSA